MRWWLWEEDLRCLGVPGRAQEVVGAALGEKKQLTGCEATPLCKLVCAEEGGERWIQGWRVEIPFLLQC